MITLNLIGSCITRDLFRIGDTAQRFKILKFCQFSSPASFCESENIRITPDELSNFCNNHNFTKRCLCHDINKSVLSAISSNPSDYLIIDLCELRFKYYRINLKNGDSFIVTATKYLKELIENDLFRKFLQIDNIETDIELSDDVIQNKLAEYARFIQEHYAPKQVILIRNLPVWRHINDSKKCFEEFWIPNIYKTRIKLNKFYDYFQTLLPEIHIVTMPEHCLGNALHLWKRDPLHFVDEYYEYLYKAVEIIVENRHNEVQALTQLKDTYSKLFYYYEQSKKYEYYISSQTLSDNILRNGSFQIINNTLNDWKTSSSKNSSFNLTTKQLESGNSDHEWVILSQTLDNAIVGGKRLTCSIDFMTDEISTINLAVTRKSGDVETYLIARQINSYGERMIFSLSLNMPNSNDTDDKFLLKIYINKPLHKATIYRAKAEIGSIGSLF